MHSNFHILVVDDLPTVRWIVTAMLNEIGYTKITQAEDGEQALKLLQSGDTVSAPIEFVVTDWHMPVMNGLALLRQIRASIDFKHLPVLMITSEAETESLETATRAGVDGYIHKPSLGTAILKETFDKILAQRRLAM